MDLTNLRDSLDSSSRERHPASASAKRSELRLTRDFKAAALQLTTLYKTSLSSSKRSYAAGYAQSLADVLDVVQLRMQQHPATAPGSRFHGLSTSAMGTATMADAEREELHWLVRYLRARLEAIKAESEEDEEMEVSEDDDEAATPIGNLSTRERSGSASISTAQQTSSSASQGKEAAATSERGQRRATRSRSPSAAKDGTEHNTAAPVFTFTAPAPSASSARTASTPSGSTRSRRGRHQHGAASEANRMAASTPPRLSRAASSDEDEVILTPTSRHGMHANARRSVPNTPSSLGGSVQSSPVSSSAGATTNAAGATAAATRLGKRRGGGGAAGRERLSNLELFGRAMTAKRRRHFGEERQGGGPDEGHH